MKKLYRAPSLASRQPRLASLASQLTSFTLYFFIILVVAAFLRFWNIPNTVQFLGDQGRDSLIVSKIFTQKDLVFIGPVTSVGNMYLGPLYYYFMVPFLMLSYPSPLGPVYAVAFMGLLTIYLMYHLGKELLGERIALIAATLMTFSATVVSGTRFSWNPNPAPLVSLIMIYFTHKALRKDVKYWAVVVLCFSILIQLHYLTLLSGLGFGALWLWQMYQKKSVKKMLSATIIGALIFLFSLTPLVLFDIKHDGLNLQAFKTILTGEESFEQLSPTFFGKVSEYLSETHGRGMHILFEIMVGEQRSINTLLLVISFVILFLSLRNVDFKKATKKERDIYFGKITIVVFLIMGILGTSLYQHTIFDHYIAYLFPVSFFALAIVGDYLYTLRGTNGKGFLGKAIVAFFIILFINYNLPALGKTLSSISWTMRDVQRAATSIVDRVEYDEKYNVVLLSGTGDIDAQNYRYFLSTTDKPPVELEDRGSIDTLFIINDDRVLKKVVDSPIYEIVVFPDKNPSEVYEVENGPEITVLRRN